MRKLSTIQKRENLNLVVAADEPGSGNASHEYDIYPATGYRKCTAAGDSIVSGGFNIFPECALEHMQIVKNYYGKTGGNGLVHFIISFNRNVYSIAYAEKLARKIATTFLFPS